MTAESGKNLIPTDILEYLLPYSGIANSYAKRNIDPFHNSLDAQHMKSVANWLGYWRREDFNTNRLNRAIELHDQGYAFVQDGLLTLDQHHFGSAFIALALDNDVELAQGILLHVEDVLPDDTKLWMRALRDINRVDRLGWYGLLMEAYYMGFTHPILITEPLRQQAVDGEPEYIDPCRDLRHPMETNIQTLIFWEDFRGPVERMIGSDYEHQLKGFCIRNVFPFLQKNGLVERMVARLDYWITRFNGEGYYLHIGNSQVPEGEEYDPEELVWTIDPVMDELEYLFRFKENNSFEAISLLGKYRKHIKGK